MSVTDSLDTVVHRINSIKHWCEEFCAPTRAQLNLVCILIVIEIFTSQRCATKNVVWVFIKKQHFEKNSQ